MEIAIVAGEVSGDIQGGRLVKELGPGIKIWGIGGRHMRGAGVELVCDITELAVVGFWEVLKNYRRIRNVFYRILKEIETRRPAAIVLVDYPGFNLRLARKVKPLGIPLIYYISPQVWAWGKGRIKQIRELVDKMIVIFPFEKGLYEKEGVPVEFVGHPVVDVLSNRASRRDEFRKELGVKPGERLIGILPGSRSQEIKRHLPVFLKAVKRIKNIKFVIGAVNVDRAYDIMEASDLILTSSGTATLETACFGTPMIVIYKLNWLTYFFIRQMISIPYIAMVNVIAGKRIVPEFVQSKATAKNVAKEAVRILEDSSIMREELSQVKQKLGDPGAVKRAARIICEAISD